MTPSTTFEIPSRPALFLPSAAQREPTVVEISGTPGHPPDHETRARVALWSGDLTRLPSAAIVKSTRRRVVARVPDDGSYPAVYVKQESIFGAWGRLRVWMSGSHAEREFRNAGELARRGIPGPRPVLFAAWKSRGWTVRTLSVTEELSGGTRLDEYLDGFEGERRREAIAEIASNLQAIHSREIDLTDCHRANLLVLAGAHGSKLQLALLDVGTVRFHVLGVARRIERLGQLLHSLRPVLTYEERRLFVERYARAIGVGQAVLEDWVREVRAAEEAVHRRRERSRDRRCVVDSTEFAVRRSWTTRIFARRSVPLEVIRRAASSAGSAGAHGVQLVKKEGRNECVVVSIDGHDCFVKRVTAESFLGCLADAVRGSRGRRAWRAAHAFARRGMPAPRALGLIEEGFLVPVRSTLVSERLAGALTLQEVAAQFGKWFESRAERTRFLTKLGELVGRLHNFDLDHGDLAVKNILVVNPKDPEFYFIDLEAVEGWYRPISRERMLRALMQLDDAPRAVTRADRMRVLVAYERIREIHLTRDDIGEIRQMLRSRFARSGRNYPATGPR